MQVPTGYFGTLCFTEGAEKGNYFCYFGKINLLSRCSLLVEFALATLKIALNGWNSSFLLPLIN